MNTKDIYNNPAGRVLGAALNAVALTAGVEGKITQTEPAAPDHCTGAIVNFTFEHKAHRYAAEVQAIDRVARLDLVKTKFNDLPGSKLLVAPYITAEMAEHCRALGLQFIDTAGNAYLKAGGMYIYITGHKRNLADMPAANDRATTATGMRVVFSLICRPELLNAPYREIAAAAGVALGTVGWVFIALQKRGHLLTDKRKRRQFVDIQRVIEEWALNYPVRLRPKLTAQRFHAPAADWWKNVRLEKYAARFGGEVAGDILTKYRNPGEVLIYLPGDPGRLIIDNRLKADPDGEVEIVEQFWHLDLKTKENRTVPPLLVYADLLATPDARNHEVAKLVYERYIKNA